MNNSGLLYFHRKKTKKIKFVEGQEDPSAAREMLVKLGFEDKITERVCYLVGHHHTYTNIEGMDYQILVEADLQDYVFEPGRQLMKNMDLEV